MVKDIGIVPNMTASESAAINGKGHVTGSGYSDEGTCAFYYGNHLIFDAGGANSRGFAINSADFVAGDTYVTQNILYTSHAAVFKGGAVTDLGVLPGQVYSRANGINTVGWVVGDSALERDSTFSRAFIWSKPTGMIDIGTLGGLYAQANAINDAGLVTGSSLTSEMEGGTHAFLAQPLVVGDGFTKPMQDLGTLIGLFGSSYGMAINSSNHVAGYSTINLSDDRVHAFLHDGAKMIDLGTLNSNALYCDTSVALGLNNYDEVVGYSYVLPAGKDMPVRQAAFIWNRGRNGVGQMTNLNDAIGSAANYYWLYSATGINDKGQIIASAYDLAGIGHALILTPPWP